MDIHVYYISVFLIGTTKSVNSGTYTIVGSPQTVVVGDKVPLTLTCTTTESVVRWRRNSDDIAVVVGAYLNKTCMFGAPPITLYNYECYPANATYHVRFVTTITEEDQHVTWLCGGFTGTLINAFSFQVIVPVKTVTLTPTGDNNVVEGETQTFTCTTDSSRPAAWIQWYIGGQNVTNQATSQQPLPDGNKFLSTSRLVYIGKDTDHSRSIYCEAVNTEGREAKRSNQKSIFISIIVKAVTLTPTGDNNAVYFEEGETQTFTCTTGTSRPAAWIQWYIGWRNVTNEATPQPQKQDGEKFISSSGLVYTGRGTDHKKTIYCEAVNIEGMQKAQSAKLSIFINIPVTKVTLSPTGTKNVVDVVEGENQTFTCTTDSSRPAAWIQWYIGGQNVSNQAVPQPPQQDGDKFVSFSILVYTGLFCLFTTAFHRKDTRVRRGGKQMKDPKVQKGTEDESCTQKEKWFLVDKITSR